MGENNPVRRVKSSLARRAAKGEEGPLDLKVK